MVLCTSLPTTVQRLSMDTQGAMRCSNIAEAEAAVSVNEKKWFVMHMHVQLKLDEVPCRAVSHYGAAAVKREAGNLTALLAAVESKSLHSQCWLRVRT